MTHTQNNSAENEARMFWRLSKEIRGAAERGEPLADHIDEIDVLRDYTDSATLKSLCTQLLTEYGSAQPEKEAGA